MAKKPDLSGQRVEVFIPRGTGREDFNLYVSVNNWTALLPRGKTSLVPRFAARELERSALAAEALYEEMASRELS